MKEELLHLYALAQFARTGPRWAPKRLYRYIAGVGGIRDHAGDVSKLTGSKRQRLWGLIDNKRGMGLDDAAMSAWDAGYIVSCERPTPSDFLDCLDRDLNVSPVYAADDFAQVEEFEAAQDARNTLDQLGILAPSKAKALQVEAALITYAEAVAI